jgi:hypothetical protein
MPEHYREEWLGAVTDRLRPEFARHGHAIPDKLRIACGWPVGTRGKVLGECWTANASADGTTEIFISPQLADGLFVAGVLTHELVHAAVGVEEGHKGAFKRLAVQLGLEGPMRSTRPGEALRKRLNALIAQVGPYPHASLGGDILFANILPGEPLPPPPPSGPWRKKAGTRLLKAECPTCGYTIRITRRWICVGLPVCPCDTRMVQSWHR